MTEPVELLSPSQHLKKATELAAAAGHIYDTAKNRGSMPAEVHAGLFREMHAVAALAQVHATLATID